MRTFIAIDLDVRVRKRLAEIQDRLRPQCPKLRWVDPNKMHLTLKFLGEIEDQQALIVSEALDELARNTAPFDIAIEKTGVFGQRGSVRVVWVGISDCDGGLARCQEHCERLLEPLGFPRENRPFHPHLTLARNKSPRHSDAIRRAVADEADARAGVQTVTSVTFYQSTPGEDGPTYRALGRHAFSK